MQKLEILGHEFIIIKEGYFPLSPTPLKSICWLACVQHPLPPLQKNRSFLFSDVFWGERVGVHRLFVCLSAYLSLRPHISKPRPQGFFFFEGKALGTRLHISACLKTLRFRKNTRPLEAYSNLFRPKHPNEGNTRVSLTGHALCKRMTLSVTENLRFRPSILTKTTLASVFNSSFVVRSKVA